jgi:hypothetical protein
MVHASNPYKIRPERLLLIIADSSRNQENSLIKPLRLTVGRILALLYANTLHGAAYAWNKPVFP